MPLLPFIRDYFWLVIIAAAPFIIAGQVYLWVRKMSEPEKMLRVFPGGLSPDKQRILSAYQSWLNANSLQYLMSYQFGIVQVATFRQKDTQRFVSFLFHKRLNFSISNFGITTEFDDDVSLETSNTRDTGMFPARTDKYRQCFPGASLELA